MKTTTYSPYARNYHADTNTRKVSYTPDVDVYYSYNTPIAVRVANHGFVDTVRYSVTSSKHRKFAEIDLHSTTDVCVHIDHATFLDNLSKLDAYLQDSIPRGIVLDR